MANKKRIAASTGACALAGLMVFGGAQILAYLTDSETATNTFTVGKVKVDLEEPNYPGDGSAEVTSLVANEPVDKDPQAENTGENTEVIFMSYDIPMADVIIVGNDGRLFTDDENFYINATYNEEDGTWTAEAGTAELLVSTDSGESKIVDTDVTVTEVLPADRVVMHQELFGVNYEDESGVNSEDWILVDVVYVDAEGNEISDDDWESAAAIRRVYAYTKLLEKDEKTSALFDEVYLKNVIEGEVDSTIQEITTKVYAIQASYLLDADGNNILDYDEDENEASSITIDADDAAAIYDIYIGQNGTNGASAEADNNNAKDLDGNTRDADQMYLNVSMSVNDTSLLVSETAQATAVVDSNYDSTSYTFAASSEKDSIVTTDVITVSEDGEITATAPGVAYVIVTGTTDSDTSVTATAYVKIIVDSELSVAITADIDEDAVLAEGDTATLTAKATTVPSDADVTYSWSSSNEAVASITGDADSATVTAGESGSAVITVTTTITSAGSGETLTSTDSYVINVQN